MKESNGFANSPSADPKVSQQSSDLDSVVCEKNISCSFNHIFTILAPSSWNMKFRYGIIIPFNISRLSAHLILWKHNATELEPASQSCNHRPVQLALSTVVHYCMHLSSYTDVPTPMQQGKSRLIR